MNVFRNANKQKKFIIVVLILILFNFCFSGNVKAGDFWVEVKCELAGMVYDIEFGILKLMNNLFADNDVTGDSGTIELTPENIIKGKFMLMDANIFKDFTSSANGYSDADQAQDKAALQSTIRGWYSALRNLAIVALLSILVYVGIRMMMTSISQDKAKYKMMFKDWLVALCLVVLMHYIMVGALGIAQMITDAVSAPGGYNSTITENLMTEINEDLTMGGDEGSSEDERTEAIGNAFANEIVFFAVIFFTGLFMVKYVIRALTIMFLILLAPITCITYPLDKISDGKAQAFNFWLKEFMYNVIIQPFHLLLYVVLLGSSTTLANENAIYAILCYAMMIPAEKLIRQMFGFQNKLGSPLGAMASGAALSKLASSAKSVVSSGGNGSGNGNGKGSSGSDSDGMQVPPKTKGSIGDYDNDNIPLSENNNSNSESNNSEDSGEEGEEFGPWQKTNMTKEEYQDKYGDTVPWRLDDNGGEQQPARDETISDENQRVPQYEEENAERLSSEGQNNSNSIEQNSEDKRYRGNGLRALGSEIGKGVRAKYGTTEAVSGFYGVKEAFKKGNEQKGKGAKARIKGFAKGFGEGHKKSWKRVLDPSSHNGVANQMFRKGLGAVGRTATRAALGLAGAGVAALGATVTGDFSKVATAAAGGMLAGNRAGKAINRATGKINQTAGRYYKTAYSGAAGKDYQREKDKKNFKNNQKERDYVAQRIYEKTGGRVATGKEIDAEMDRRYDLRQMGITDNDLIDATLDMQDEKYAQGIASITGTSASDIAEVEENLNNNSDRYKKDYEKLTSDDITDEYRNDLAKKFDEKHGEGGAEKALEHSRAMKDISEQQKETAKSAAVSQASYAARIANSYGKGDFRDEKKMTGLQESMQKEYLKNAPPGTSTERANKVVTGAILDAAKLKGVEANIPQRGRRGSQTTSPREERPTHTSTPNPNPAPNSNPSPTGSENQ